MKILSIGGNRVVYRIIILIPLTIAIILLISFFFKKNFIFIVCSCINFSLSYFFNLFYIVKCDEKYIYVLNMMVKKKYLKDHFLDIKPIFPYMNVYYIRFIDGKRYLFGVASSRNILTENKNGFSKELKDILLK